MAKNVKNRQVRGCNIRGGTFIGGEFIGGFMVCLNEIPKFLTLSVNSLFLKNFDILQSTHYIIKAPNYNIREQSLLIGARGAEESRGA